MSKRDNGEAGKVEPQSKSMTGQNPENPNADGQTSQIQPGSGADATNAVAGQPSDGGNAAANEGGANSPTGPQQ